MPRRATTDSACYMRLAADRRPVPYTVPMPTEQNLFSLDARLFTNGWVNVLKDTELAFLCMVADLQAREQL